MANEHQSVGKCRFYIDSTQYNRALGNVNSNQNFTNASNGSIGINANEMFSNNPSTLWSTDYNGACMFLIHYYYNMQQMVQPMFLHHQNYDLKT